MSVTSSLADAVAALDLTAARAAAVPLMSSADGRRVLFTQLQDGTDRVLQAYEAGEYFLADLMMANYIYRELVGQLLRDMPAAAAMRGTVLVGVVQGDVHDIGKSIIMLMLQFAGFRVIDLGVDVSPERFVHGVLTHAPDVLLLSGTIRSSAAAVEATVNAVREAKLDQIVQIAVGGSCIDEAFAERLGVLYSSGANETLRLCRDCVEGRAELD